MYNAFAYQSNSYATDHAEKGQSPEHSPLFAQ